jgi:hypothetical protein
MTAPSTFRDPEGQPCVPGNAASAASITAAYSARSGRSVDGAAAVAALLAWQAADDTTTGDDPCH